MPGYDWDGCGRLLSGPKLLHALLIFFIIFIVLSWPSQPTYEYNNGIPNMILSNQQIMRAVSNETLAAPNNSVMHCNVIEWNSLEFGNYQCVNINVQPETKICIYDRWSDVYISHDLETTGMWEPHVLSDLKDALDRDSELGLIDIGANLGFYSLIAAKLGHPVVAVEPYMEHIKRFQKSVHLGNLQRQVTLVGNAVSDVRTNATLKSGGDNMGDIRIEHGVFPCIGDCPQTTTTILLDDLLEVITFKRGIIKVDAQGFEPAVFAECSKLLETIFVPYIYTEWLVMKSHYKASNHSSYEKAAVTVLVKNLLSWNFKPYSLDSEGGRVLDPGEWHTWPDDIVWRHTLTEQERTEALKRHYVNWPL